MNISVKYYNMRCKFRNKRVVMKTPLNFVFVIVNPYLCLNICKMLFLWRVTLVLTISLKQRYFRNGSKEFCFNFWIIFEQSLQQNELLRDVNIGVLDTFGGAYQLFK